MYKPTKKLLTCGLALSLIAAGSFSVVADEKEVIDAGISSKVEDYIAEAAGEDPVSELTQGAATILEEEPEIEISLRNEVSSELKPSLMAAEERAKGEARALELMPAQYPQFEDRALAAVTGKLNIRSEADAESEIVGTLARGGVCLVYETEDGWTRIASGNCEGYVMSEYLVFGDDAGRWAEENDIAKEATVTAESLKVRVDSDLESQCLTMIPEGESYEVLDTDGDWTLLAVDYDIQGYVNNEFIDVTFKTVRAVTVEEQEAMDAAARAREEEEYQKSLQAETAQPKEQQTEAPQQQVTETTEAARTEAPQTEAPQTEAPTEAPQTEAPTEAPTEQVVKAPSGSGGDAVVAYAMQFLGNPYVWGGSSLTKGADCSGFTMSVYAAFGYYLPHNAAAQSNCGTPVSLDALLPGDLLFYNNGGGIGHVAMYMGGGQVIHASSPSTGIKISSYNYRTPCKAVRILP